MERTKKGRRPKKQTLIFDKQGSSVALDTPIIAHLPIMYSDIINDTNNDIFIKNDMTNNEFTEIEKLKKHIDELTLKLTKYEKNIKPVIMQCSNNSKCWWCKYAFNTHSVEMPESYYNGVFNCTGIFCSWECMMAYSIDINDDNIQKRCSLINMMYWKTYNTYKVIKPAPSWKILIDFGGTISIDEYRASLTINDMDYNYIKPPMISRISYIEKIPIKSDIDVVKMNELILKRTKPLKSSKYPLESIMGLKKIINNNSS